MVVVGVEEAGLEVVAAGVDGPHRDVVLAPGAGVAPHLAAQVAVLGGGAAHTPHSVVELWGSGALTVLPVEEISQSVVA